MVNDKYLYLIQLCMELQRGEDGRINIYHSRSEEHTSELQSR